jgi:hypothetical protein
MSLKRSIPAKPPFRQSIIRAFPVCVISVVDVLLCAERILAHTTRKTSAEGYLPAGRFTADSRPRSVCGGGHAAGDG